MSETAAEAGGGSAGPPPPPPPPPSDDELSAARHSRTEAASRQSKLHGINIISEFESKRRGYFLPQINSNGHHWHAFAATLTRSQQENERIFDFFHKRLEQDSKYAALLAEAPNMDLKGGGGWRKDKKSSSGSATTSSSSDSSKPQQPPSSSSSVRGPTGFAKVAVPAMDEVVTSTEALAVRIGQYVASTRKELMEGKLKTLVSVFKETSDEILGEGEHSLDNVTKAEQGVQAAYQEYAKAVEPLAGGGSIQPVSGAGGGGGGGGDSQAPSDLWIQDMNYRVAVELQKAIWAETQIKLHDLFTRMKTLELNRRQHLHGLILRFVQNQGAFWGTWPQMASDSALRISGLTTDPQEVESELSDEIRTGAKAVEQEQQAKRGGGAGARRTSAADAGSSSSSSTSTTSSSSPSSAAASSSSSSTVGPPSDPFTGTLTSPLEVALVKRVEVLEHRLTVGVESMPLLKRWRPALAVLTIDNFLHLFDLPTDILSGAEISPKEAFRKIIPKPIDAKGRFKKGRDAERIHPSASLCLDFSKARYRPEDGPEVFEITESLANTGFVKVFKSHETKRVVLKAKGQERMVDWVVQVNQQGGGGETGRRK